VDFFVFIGFGWEKNDCGLIWTTLASAVGRLNYLYFFLVEYNRSREGVRAPDVAALYG